MQRLEVAPAVSMDLLQLWKQFGMSVPTIEEGHRMPALQRCLNEITTQKTCTPKNKKLHAFPFSLSSCC